MSHRHKLFSVSKRMSNHTLSLLSRTSFSNSESNFSIFCNLNRLKFSPNIKFSFILLLGSFLNYSPLAFYINIEKKPDCTLLRNIFSYI